MRSSVKHDAGTLDADGLMLIKGGAKRKKHEVDPKMAQLLNEDEEIERERDMENPPKRAKGSKGKGKGKGKRGRGKTQQPPAEQVPPELPPTVPAESPAEQVPPELPPTESKDEQVPPELPRPNEPVVPASVPEPKRRARKRTGVSAASNPPKRSKADKPDDDEAMVEEKQDEIPPPEPKETLTICFFEYI